MKSIIKKNQKMEKKSQAALEHLMVYGWALAVIVIVLFALFLIVKPSNVIEEEKCQNFKSALILSVSTNTKDFNFLLINSSGRDWENLSFDLNGVIGSHEVNKHKTFSGNDSKLKAGESNLFTIQFGTPFYSAKIGQKYELKLTMYFTENQNNKKEFTLCTGKIGTNLSAQEPIIGPSIDEP